MNGERLNIVILGLSITSSWGNGHATTFRGLVRALDALGHKVSFLERDVPWYAANRDLPEPPYGRTFLYESLDDLDRRFAARVREADAVIIGSYVPEGVEVGKWAMETAGGVVAFYDIDTPVTLSRLKTGDFAYLSPELVPRYDIYLSFAGGQALRTLEEEWGAQRAAPLYCSVDPSHYSPAAEPGVTWDLGYMGTYSSDRQPPLDQLLLQAARRYSAGRFVVAGPQYPASIAWPSNVERIDHLPPSRHCDFYNRQRFTLNITRADMVALGHSPSVRLFEAAACATPVISDWWEGLDAFFTPGEEILISQSPEETLRYLQEIPEEEAGKIGRRAREKVLKAHTATHRAQELAQYIREIGNPAAPSPQTSATGT